MDTPTKSLAEAPRPAYHFTERVAIPLVTRRPDELQRTLVRLRRVLSRGDHDGVQGKPRKALLELAGCRDIDAAGIILLTYVSRRLQERNIELWVGGKQGVVWQKVLRHIQHRRQGQVVKAEAGELLLRQLEGRAEMVSTLDTWAKNLQTEAGAAEEQLARWSTNITEVATNSFQHGGAHVRWMPHVAGEVERGGKTVLLAALDFGRGIPDAISEFAPAPLRGDDGALIAHACERLVTSRSVRENQGAGLADLVDTVSECTGSLQIVSGDGMAHWDRGSMNTRLLRSSVGKVRRTRQLSGTLTIIRLPIR